MAETAPVKANISEETYRARRMPSTMRQESRIYAKRVSTITKWKDSGRTFVVGDNKETDDLLLALTWQMAYLTVFSLLLIMTHNQVCWNKEWLIFSDSFEECWPALPLKVLNLVVSLILATRIIAFYRIQSKLVKCRDQLCSVWEAFYGTELIWKFMVEMIVAIWQPIPGVAHIWGLGHKLVIMMASVRSYLVLRLLHQTSPMHRWRHEIELQRGNVISKHRGKHHKKVSVDLGTVLKGYFYTKYYTTIGTLTIAATLFFSYVVYILERELWVPIDWTSGLKAVPGKEFLGSIDTQIWEKSPFSDFFNCIWFTSVVATTLGFGDMVPYSARGKIVAIGCCITGIIVVSLVVGMITNLLSPTPYQQRLIEWVKFGKLKLDKQHAAARLIQAKWKFYKHFKESAGFSSLRPDQLLHSTPEKPRQSVSRLQHHYPAPAMIHLKRSADKFASIVMREIELDEGRVNEFQGMSRQMLVQQQNLDTRMKLMEEKFDTLLQYIATDPKTCTTE